MASAQAAAAISIKDIPPHDINTPPQAGQNIAHDGNDYTTIKEGLAYILVPHDIPTSTDPKLSKEDTAKQQVFYNPIQQFNRDLSVLAIKAFSEGLVATRKAKQAKTKEREQKKKNALKRRSPSGNHAQESASAQAKRDSSPSKRMRLDQAEVLVGEESHDAGVSIEQATDMEMSAAMPNGADKAFNGEAETRDPKTPFTILDALSATGLRALRYAQEIPFATSVVANDLSAKATSAIDLNVKHNKLGGKIKAHTGNAIAYMYSFVGQKGFDVIDLDPYGTAAPFLDAAVQATNDGGLLCITCTDSAIFASHGYLEKTYSQYGGLPLKGEACHEGGIRLVLHAVSSSAARYGLAIEPLLSLSIDYYIRVFVRVRKSPNEVKLLAGKTMVVYNCDYGCGAWTTQYLARHSMEKARNGNTFSKHSFAQGPSADQLCAHCGSKTHLAGPMYGGPIHNTAFIERVLAQLQASDSDTYATKDRIEGMLRTAHDEITFGAKSDAAVKDGESMALDPVIPSLDMAAREHHPFYFIPSSISKIIHCQAPSTAAVRGALKHAGFRVTMSHCKPGSIRTDASWTDLWHIMLEWVRQKAPLQNRVTEKKPGYNILSKGSAYESQAYYAERARAQPTKHNVTPPETANKVAGGGGSDAATNASTTAPRDAGHRKDATPSYLSSKFEVVFDEKLGKDVERGKYVRYQLAPRANWGPMSRAK